MESEKSVGTILKEAREAKGISLLEAERGTSIRKRYLEAVENDDYKHTPGEVFLKGMIRTYGNYLGLDGLELVNIYKASATGKAAEALHSAAIREVDNVQMRIRLKEKRDIGSGTGRFEMPDIKIPFRQLAVGCVALVILGAGYFAVPRLVDYANSMPKAETKQEQAAPVPTVPVVVDKATVEMIANGDCWLEVRADGKEVFAALLREKERKTFEAKERLVIKYGNIGVMELKVNGKDVDLKGEHGVAVKTYTKES